jgi:hypothetical protein
MKLVKARPKLLEYLPDWALCCSDYQHALTTCADLTIDLQDSGYEDDVHCVFCNADHGRMFVVRDADADDYLPLECFDLDEGTPCPT